MAIITNTYETYDAKGEREDLADVIYNISPEDTPFMSMSGRSKASAVTFEWQTDSLAAVDTANAQIEGDDVTSFQASTATARVGNVTQISRKTVILAGTLEAIDKAGRRSELAYQIAKRGSELKRDMEAIGLENIGGSVAVSDTARTTATLGAWVKTNTDKSATSSGDPAYTAGVPAAARTDGTQRAFTETILKSVIQKVWTSGGTLKYLMVGPVNKQKASAFSGIATKNYDLSGRPRPTAIVAAADVYVSDFGILQIVPNRFQRERDGWLLDFDYIDYAYLRPFRTEKLAKTGDAEKRMLLVEWGLKVKQEAALGLAADLTTS